MLGAVRSTRTLPEESIPMTRSPTTRWHVLPRAFLLLLILAIAATVVAPAASAHRGTPPLRSTERVELNIYDAYLSQQCGIEVVATLSGVERRTVYRGREATSPAREVTTFDGRIRWEARESGKTYADRLDSVLHIAYPEGIELFKPAKVTVVGQHGGTFPIGGGPAGTGILVYDATVYAEADGFPYWFVNGDPTFQRGTFAWTAKRICARLT
jgi:hypothetical protein